MTNGRVIVSNCELNIAYVVVVPAGCCEHVFIENWGIDVGGDRGFDILKYTHPG